MESNAIIDKQKADVKLKTVDRNYPSFNHMEKKIVKDIMTREVVTVSPDAKINEVAEILSGKRLHALPVIENGKVAGIITENDFFIKSVQGFYLPSYIEFLQEFNVVDGLSAEKKIKLNQLLNTKAKDIMTRNCVTILPDMKIHDLFNFFKETGYVSFPVVDENYTLKGIVTLADVISVVKICD